MNVAEYQEFELIDPITDSITDNRHPSYWAVQPDLDEIDERLGFSEPGHPILTAQPDENEIAGRKLGEILEFITAPTTLQAMGARAVGLSACLRPELFENRSMTDLARGFGITKQALNKYFRAVRDRFGLRSVYSKSDEAREAYRMVHAGKKGAVEAQ
jgi:hypothetical protein